MRGPSRSGIQAAWRTFIWALLAGVPWYVFVMGVQMAGAPKYDDVLVGFFVVAVVASGRMAWWALAIFGGPNEEIK